MFYGCLVGECLWWMWHSISIFQSRLRKGILLKRRHYILHWLRLTRDLLTHTGIILTWSLTTGWNVRRLIRRIIWVIGHLSIIGICLLLVVVVMRLILQMEVLLLWHLLILRIELSFTGMTWYGTIMRITGFICFDILFHKLGMSCHWVFVVRQQHYLLPWHHLLHRHPWLHGHPGV